MEYSEWTSFKLSELVEIIGGGTPKKNVTEYWDGPIPWLSVKDFNNDDRLVYDTDQHITELGLLKSSTKLLEKGDVIISARGTVGEIAQLARPMAFNQSCYGLRSKKNLTTNEFIYYWLKHNVGYVKSNTHGSIFDTITKNTFDNLIVILPPLEKQRAITKILTKLDDRIEINKKTINTLEKLAQTLFKNWFVDFEFPDENGEPYKSNGGKMVEGSLREIPDGWKFVSLVDIMDYQGGSQPPAKEFVDCEKEGYVRLVQIRDYDTDNHLTYIPDTKKLKRCTKTDIMIARYGAALGRILFGLEGAYNVALAKVIPNSPHYREYLRNYLKSKEFYDRINGMGERSAQSGFNKSDIRSFKIPFPSNEEILEKFDLIGQQMVEMILMKREETIKLVNLRGTLLPKLLSGEMELPDETEVNEYVSIP